MSRGILTLWRELWEARWPEGICRLSAVHGVELERLADELGAAELEARIARYLATGDAWLLRHKHPLGTFLRQINSYETPAAEREPAILKRIVWRAVGRDGRVWLETARARVGQTVRLETATPGKLAPYHEACLAALRAELGDAAVTLAIVAAPAAEDDA